MNRSDVVIDHQNIHTDDLELAVDNAHLSPDGEVYPWLPLYPLAGQTVYWDGKLWTVYRKERGSRIGIDTDFIKLTGYGHDAVAVATAGELRPVTWTQSDEHFLAGAN